MTVNAPAQLFPDDRPAPRPKPAYQVGLAGGSVIVRSPNLPFALAQARAVALGRAPGVASGRGRALRRPLSAVIPVIRQRRVSPRSADGFAALVDTWRLLARSVRAARS